MRRPSVFVVFPGIHLCVVLLAGAGCHGTPSPDPYIELVGPVGGETWAEGSTRVVEWNAYLVSSFKVELSRDNGTSWQEIAIPPDERWAHWIIRWPVTDGGQVLPQTECLVRVSVTVDGAPSVTSGAFTIKQRTVWHVDGTATAGGDGLGWPTALQHPQDALDQAAMGDEIWVAAGTYTRPGSVVVNMRPGVALYGGFVGDETVRDARDWAVNTTTLDGQGTAYHVVTGDSEAILDGFTVTGGNANGPEGNDMPGGGMLNLGTIELLVENCTFTSNSASSHGGGMRCFGGAIEVRNSRFLSNTAAWDGGGAMFSHAQVTVGQCIFEGNVADMRGGGIFQYNMASYPEVLACVFVGNTAGWDGGAFYDSGSYSPALTNCVFRANSAIDHGGAVYYQQNAYPTFMNSTFSGNTAGQTGGAVCSGANAPVIVNCILWGDSAAEGSELWTSASSSPTVTYSNVEGGYSGEGNIGNDLVMHDPLFVDPDGLDNIPGTADDDLHLSSSSPCIDTCTVGGAPDHDLDGNPRPEPGGTLIDMGAYEYQP